jgi:hypothetical protein
MKLEQIPKNNKQIPNKSQIQMFNDANGLEFGLLRIEIYLDFRI